MDKYEYYVERAASKGNARALYLCALLRLRRKGSVQSVVQLLKRAASSGESLAYYELAKLYDSFESGFRCVSSAVEMCLKGYERGDFRTATMLGDLCVGFVNAGCSVQEFCINDEIKTEQTYSSKIIMQGLSLDQRPDGDLQGHYLSVAKEWYRIGASHGDGAGFYRLAESNERDLKCGDDAGGILELYRKAAECGEARGALALGQIFEKGCVAVKDLTRAKEWYSTAAEMGSAEAVYRLGVLLNWNGNLISTAEEMGYVSPENYPRQYSKLEALAKAGNAQAQYDTARILVNGDVEGDGYSQWEIEKDETSARMWFRRAAALGCVRAYGMLGLLEERQDLRLFKKPHENRWFVRGAERGLGYACWKLYKERCDSLSVYSHDLARLQSNPTPINTWTLGRIYDDGLVSDRDPKMTAYHFYRQAGDAGFTPGIVSACKLVLRGYVTDASLDVFNSLLSAASTGDVGAVYWLAYCLETGWGCECDLHGAIRLYYLAANFGNVSAMVGFGRTALRAFGQEKYFGHDISPSSQARAAASYLIEIADALQLKNRYFVDVGPAEYLSLAVDKGNEEALEVLARYWAAPCYTNRVGYGNDETTPHDLYFEESLKKAVPYYEQAIAKGRINLASELNQVRQRLAKCIDGRYRELLPRAVSSEEIPF